MLYDECTLSYICFMSNSKIEGSSKYSQLTFVRGWGLSRHNQANSVPKYVQEMEGTFTGKEIFADQIVYRYIPSKC